MGHLALVATAGESLCGIKGRFSGKTLSSLGILLLAFLAVAPSASGAELPEGRAYELVTPADTNGIFMGALSGAQGNFSTPLASPDGNSVIFNTEGSLPDLEGNGTINGYRAVRGADGWTTRSAGPNGIEAVAPGVGGTSADHLFSFWLSGTKGGSLDQDPEGGAYLRGPSGDFEPIGQGTLGTDPLAEGRLITTGGTHVIFTTESGTAVPLEPDAPAAGTAAIYDRSVGGPTHVVSLLPGDVAPVEDAVYQGASRDGSAVVFKVSETMYIRRDNATTVPVATEEPTFQGVSEDGARVFYRLFGDLFAFDVDTATVHPVGSGGVSTAVNISSDGSHVYFSSPQQLDGEKGTAGARNLYVWDGGEPRFIAVLSPRDFQSFSGSVLVRHGRWTEAVLTPQTGNRGPTQSPSRTSRDGSIFVFQSHGVVGYPYDSEGFSKIYRYNDEDGSLVCISCPLGGSGASSEDELQSTRQTVVGAPTNNQSRVQNITDDESTIFFQSREPLVAGDTDGFNDVYQWSDGKVSLISSGRSGAHDYLYAMTPDGHDVFFKTGDALVPRDESGGAGSIYDARIGGGFPEPPQPEPCAPEGSCQVPAEMPSLPPFTGSSTFVGPADPRPGLSRKRARKRRLAKRRLRAKKRQAKQSRTNRNRGGGK